MFLVYCGHYASVNVFFFNDTATTEIYTLSLHDALPICIPWRMLPEEFGCSGVTCWRRLRDWQEAGVWHRLCCLLLEKLRCLGLLDWSRASVDSASVPAQKGGEDRSESRSKIGSASCRERV